MTIRLLTLSAALLLLPSAAFAAPSARTDEGASINSDGPVRELTFDEADNVDGEVLSPNGVNVGGRRADDHANMIVIRPHFIDKLIAMSNDI